jgi:hypothetical protein
VEGWAWGQGEKVEEWEGLDSSSEGSWAEWPHRTYLPACIHTQSQHSAAFLKETFTSVALPVEACRGQSQHPVLQVPYLASPHAKLDVALVAPPRAPAVLDDPVIVPLALLASRLRLIRDTLFHTITHSLQQHKPPAQSHHITTAWCRPALVAYALLMPWTEMQPRITRMPHSVSLHKTTHSKQVCE